MGFGHHPRLYEQRHSISAEIKWRKINSTAEGVCTATRCITQGFSATCAIALQGWWPAAKGKLTAEDEIGTKNRGASSRQTRAGSGSSHPIRVKAEKGCVTLEGPILANEVDGLVSAIRSVVGVREVQNRLQAHEEPGNIPDLQDDTERPRERSDSCRRNWSPTARLVASRLGDGLEIYGLRARGPLAKATATVGAGLLARGVSN
jgi:hypothetical protein